MLQTSRRIRMALVTNDEARAFSGLMLALHLGKGKVAKPTYPSLGAARAAAMRRKPSADTIAVLWPADEYATAADAVQSAQFSTVQL